MRMPTGADAQRAMDAVRRACAGATTAEELFAAIVRPMHEVVPYDGALWLGADPSTGLATSPVLTENIESGHCETYWQREFLVEDALLFRDVARATPAIGTLRARLADRPRRSARYRECIAPQGYDDELRAAFQVDGETWGLLSLMRERGRPAFSADDTAAAGQLLAPIAEALRRTCVLADGGAGREPEGPGLIMFDPHGELMSLNDQARAWLDELPIGPLTADGIPLPTQVMASVARARAIAQGREDGQARLRVRSRSGRWLVVHASSLRLADGASATPAWSSSPPAPPRSPHSSSPPTGSPGASRRLSSSSLAAAPHGRSRAPSSSLPTRCATTSRRSSRRSACHHAASSSPTCSPSTTSRRCTTPADAGSFASAVGVRARARDRERSNHPATRALGRPRWAPGIVEHGRPEVRTPLACGCSDSRPLPSSRSDRTRSIREQASPGHAVAWRSVGADRPCRGCLSSPPLSESPQGRQRRRGRGQCSYPCISAVRTVRPATAPYRAKMACAGRWSRRSWDLLSSGAHDARR